MINPTKLDQELKNAGIEISGCNANGVVWDLIGNEIQGQANVQALIAAHDPIEYDLSPEMPLVGVGETVVIHIKGAQGTAVITIDGVNLDVDIDATGSAIVEFIPDSPGEYVIIHAGNVAIIKAV